MVIESLEVPDNGMLLSD